MRNLSPKAVHSFWDELEKVAVDATDLFNSVSRAKGVIIGKSKQAIGGGAAVYYPSVDKYESMLAHRERPLRAAADKASQIIDRLPFARLRDKASEQLEGAKSGYRAVRDAQAVTAKDEAGNIYVNPKMLAATMNTRPSNAISATAAAHELHERRVILKNMSPLYSHAAPEVLLKEHNLLSRLTGAGAGEARRAMRAFRNTSGEASHMKQLLTDAYGPRAAVYTAEGEKIPKAMLRNLRKRIQEDPGLIDRAKKNVPTLSLRERARAVGENLKMQFRAGKAALEENKG